MSTILYFSLLIVDTLAMLNVVLIVEVLFGAKMATNRKKYMLAAAIYFVIELLMEMTLDSSYEVPIAIMEYAMMVLVTVFFTTEKRIRSAVLTFSAVFCYLQWCYVGDLIEMLFGLDKYSAIVDGVTITPSYIITDCTLLLLMVYLRHTFKKRNFRMQMTVLEIVFVTIFCIFAPILTEILAALESVFQYSVYNFMWVIFVLILNFAVVYAIWHRKKASYYRELSSTYKQQFDDEYTYFKNYKDSNKNMMSFRHDWNNHMIVMQDLFEQGKYEEAKKYFESFPSVKRRKIKRVISGNETVDTIFAAKEDKFADYQIELVFNGSLTRIRTMEPVDICILFSNLIDNAIEELVKVQGKRYFHINVTESPNLTMIIFKNNMAGDLIRSGDEIKTSKADSINHGIGLQNVKDIVAKYHGEYSFEADGNEFVTKVILPM